MKRLSQLACGIGAGIGWYNLQLFTMTCVYTEPDGLIPFAVWDGLIQILCWAALLRCVKGGLWKGTAVPVLCGIFSLIDLWWIVGAMKRMLWYYYGFPQFRVRDILGILGVLFCAVGICVNTAAAILALRRAKRNQT